MKLKRRRVLEVPPKIRSFINGITATPLENIEQPLKRFIWEFDKGDFHHWVDLFNHFDSYFEKHIKPRKDLQVEDNFLEADPPFPREAILQILRVIRIILENCTNKHFYSSYEQHLSSLLASTDGDVVEACLQTLAAFLKKTIGKCSIRDSALNSKLFAFSQGWGGKEEGLGLISCSTENGCDSVAYELGCTLHFEFYAVNDPSNEPSDVENSSRGLQVIHLPNIISCHENDLELLHKLVMEYQVPPNLRFSLLTRLRFARAFGSLAARQQYICIRLYAFVVLVQASNDADELAAFFNNEPEFVNELVSLISYEDAVPEKIRILGILSLVALCQDRSRQPTVLTAVTSGGHRGILPSLMQKAIDSIISDSSKWSVVFAEALLSLVTVLVSSSSGCSALREAGFIPTLLPLLKDTNPQHLHLVSTAVHVLEAFMDYSNPAATLFRDLGGLDDTIARLKVEVCYVEKGSKNEEESQCNLKEKAIVDDCGELDIQPLYSEVVVAYHRRLLMKALLRAISLGTYAPGSTSRVYGSEESLLPHCLCIIFRRSKDFGGGVFSLAATVMSDLIHKDPTCFSVLDSAGLPHAFLDAILGGILCSAEAVTCIPQCLDALCLNNVGLQAVKDCNALRCFVKIFTSRTYLRALPGDTPGSLSNGLDELMRHTSSLRGPGVDMLLEILNTISKIGSGVEAVSSSSNSLNSSSAPVPMETDIEERALVSLDDGDSSKIESSEQITEASPEGSSANVESFLPVCISNAACLLENILQNADTCRVFIEKKGIEAVLQLFTMPLVPISASIGQSISVAFKSFSPQHSAVLARVVSAFLREHIKTTNESLSLVSGTRLADLEVTEQMKILRCLSSLEALLLFSNFLLKGTTTMVSELGSADADILKDLGRSYKEVLWQISLCSGAKLDEKPDQEIGLADASVSNSAGRESDDDGNLVSVVRYANPVTIRNGSRSHWSGEPEFLSMVHRHGRREHGLTRTRGGRTSWQVNISHIDPDGSSTNAASEISQVQDVKKKSPEVFVSEILNKLASSMRSFHTTLVKGFTAPNRRRADSGSLNSASKSLATALAKFFHEALSYSGSSNSSGLEMSLSVKCRYLGKVVDDMVALTFDSRRRACNTALINNFYVHGTFKELLTTFEATSQLLWTLPFPIPHPGIDQEKTVEGNKLPHSPWLLETLQRYCRMLECFVNSSLLLSPASASQAQLLVQPVAPWLSIGLFSVPRDPEVFVRMLQSQVLDVILPVWNHTMFPDCCSSFITSMVSIVTHIYSGVGDVKRNRNAISGSTNQRFAGPPPDESTIATIVEMGFTRARAEEALRRVETNSVEMAMEWLFSHAEEPAQEDDELARALALSLGNSSETSKEENNDKVRDVPTEERGAEPPPIDDILAASQKLFQSSDSIAFQLTDLLVTLCSRNKGEDRLRVVSYLIQQLKLCRVDFSKEIPEMGFLCTISHILALMLSEDTGTRGIAAENGVVSVALDILTNFKTRNEGREDVSVPKCMSALLLILDNMLQSKPNISAENSEEILLGSSSRDDTSISLPASVRDSKSVSDGHEKEIHNPFEKILGKPTGYLTVEESHRALEIACEFIRQQAPAVIMQAVLPLCARLTKSHTLAMQFLECGGLAALFALRRNCFFPGYDSVASAIIRHLLEDPQTLQTAMELEIRQTLTGTLSRQAGRLSPRTFLTSMAPVISRDPVIFMRAAASVCQLESSGGRLNVVLLKEKEKDKEKDKLKAAGIELGGSSNECVRIHETTSKFAKGHKRVPQSLTLVIDQLLEIILSYPSPEEQEECASSITRMDVDGPGTKEKGKSKIYETKKAEGDGVSERSTLVAKVTFVLKLMSDILMYVHAVGVVLRRDSDACQLRGPGIVDGTGHGGILHHILHRLLPLSSVKTAECPDEWREKLSEKASWFVVVLCGRSGEGRRRVIAEIVRTFSVYLNSENSSKHILLPDRKVLAFTDLVNSILSKNSASGSLPGPACSPDIAKTMIDGGMIQALTGILQVIDLDHPNAPKVVNLILKALESLTRVANASEQVYKSDGPNKKKNTGLDGRPHDQTNVFSGSEAAEHNQNTNNGECEAANLVQVEEQELGASHNGRVQVENINHSMERDIRTDMEENMGAHPAMEHEVEFMREDMEQGGPLHDTNGVAMTFRVEHRRNDDLGDEDDEEDMGDDGEDDDEDDDEDEDIAEEGAALMSLADTDVEDHDDNGLGDEYNDDLIDEEDDDFHESRVIEVRWGEGLDGLDHLQVLGRPGGVSGLIDVAGEPFQGINVDDIFGLRRPVGVDTRRRQTGNRPFLERSSLDLGSAFQHPLLVRPSQSGDANFPIWSSTGSSSRDVETNISVGNFDVAHLYMFDAPVLPPEHAAAALFGDRLVGGAPPPLIDFSIGMDPLHLAGRRGAGDGRWTDDGQPQAGGLAAAIAQAVEEQFVSQLRSLAPADVPQSQRLPENMELQEKQQSDMLPSNTGSQLLVATVDGVENEQREGQQQALETDLAEIQENLTPENEDSVGRAAEEGLGAQEATLISPDGCNIETNTSESMQVAERTELVSGQLELIPEIVPSSVELSSLDPQSQVLGFHSGTNGPLGTESQSSGHPLLDCGFEVAADVEMDGEDIGGNQVEGTGPVSENGLDEQSGRQGMVISQDSNQGEQINVSNETLSTNTIDPTFLEALPEDLRAEVLASQQAQSVRTANYAPPPSEDIDPEFLAALPPDIQAEVLAQQRAQRVIQSQQSEGQPVDMDNASIIATFPADLREEVLLTSSEAVLAALPSPLLAEAQMLRDRAMSHYQARSLFGGGHRLNGRRNGIAIDRQTVMDRGVGVTIGRRAVSAIANSLKVQEVEGTPLLDTNALKALIRLLRLAQPLSKGLLQRLLLNLCAHSVTRAALVRLLLNMIEPEATGFAGGSTAITSQRLYGCQWNVVYGRPLLSDGLPPLVSRRILEILTYLATNHLSVASILFYFDPSLYPETPDQVQSELKKEKGKGKVAEGTVSSSTLEIPQDGDIPLILFLKLLNQPLFLRSIAHLEQVMGLLQVVVNNAASKGECQPLSGEVAPNSQTLPDGGTPLDTQKDPPTSQQNSGQDSNKNSSAEMPNFGGKRTVNPYDIFSQLPEPELGYLCSLLAHEGLSDKVYTFAAEVLKKLAFVATPRWKFFVSELAGLAHGLSGSAVGELITLGSTHMLGLSAGSMAGAAILRVLQALSTLTSAAGDGNKVQDNNGEQDDLTITWELNLALEPLWQELSACISKTETNLGQNSTFSSPVSNSNVGEHTGGGSALSPPLPPGTQRLLPFIEAFFVLCEKLQANHAIMQQDSINATAREVKESAGTSSASSQKCGMASQRRLEGSMTFARFADKHRRLLNAFIRQNPGLLEKSLSLMLKAPRLIDFDNKRAYFRSRIRQQHEQHPSAPLRITVRRAYVLEDSYNQLRMRSSQDLKGRLNVQFQGEEGIDAGGLTREWYQLLSRVIFDKGALLFTTVGNNSSFQPNPNSVYQTEHLSYFKFVGRVVAKALFDGQLLDVYFTRSFYKHILGVKVTYHDIEAVDPDYYKNLKWMLENDVNDIPDLTFSMDADEEKHILYEKTEVTDYELIPGGRNIRVMEETKHEYVDLVAEHRLTTAIRPQINSFLEGFNELVPRDLISIFNDKELELLISGLPEIDLDDLKANAEYTGYTAASGVIQWFWEVVKTFNKEDMARLLQFVTGTSKVPLEGFKALQGISGPQRFQIHKAYGAPERLPSAHTCFNQLDLPEYTSKEQLQERLLLAIHEASEGFGFG